MPNCKYHNTCLRKLSRDEKYIIRTQHIKTSTEQRDNSAGKSDWISRSSMPSFDRENCFLCQINSFETVHLISQFSKNEELLNAFKESPVALGIYKIHYERTLDATAGDLKYHTSCWRNIIFKREKRVQTFETSASTLNISTKDAPPQEIDKKDHTFHTFS